MAGRVHAEFRDAPFYNSSELTMLSLVYEEVDTALMQGALTITIGADPRSAVPFRQFFSEPFGVAVDEIDPRLKRRFAKA